MLSMYEMMLDLLRPNGRDVRMVGPDRIRVDAAIQAASEEARDIWEETRMDATDDADHIERFLAVMKDQQKLVAV